MAFNPQTAGSGDDARAASRNYAALGALAPFLAPYRVHIALAVLILTAAAGTVLAMGQLLRRLVDDGFALGDAGLLNGALLFLLGASAVLALASYGRLYMVSWIGERVVADVRRAVYARVIRLEPAYFEVTRTGEVLSRLTADTTLLQVVIGSAASTALRNGLTAAGGLVMLTVTSWQMTGLVLLVVPLVVAPIVVFGRKVRRLSRETLDRVADVSACAEENLNALTTVQAFGHEPLSIARFGERAERAFRIAVRRIRARALLSALVIALVFGAIGVLIWIGGHRVLAGDLSGGELSAFVFYAALVAGAVGSISEVIGDLQRAAGATERLMDLIATRPAIAAPAVPTPLPRPVEGRLSLENVVFRYPGRPDRSVLDGFDLNVAPGETVALVGPSGSGKTTVFRLLLRFYDPASGTVRLDGVDLRAADPGAVRACMGVVAQDPVIFAADAWENIRYGRTDASDAEVRAAAEAAHATEFLDPLPDGFSTFLGEKGVRLSGGQRQRIAIARAILRNPTVLLLDEATSALDAESEHMVQAALERVMRGRTTLIIAHRLATVLSADRIAVIDAGRAVAGGRHADLLKNSPLYARLAELQFARDRAA